MPAIALLLAPALPSGIAHRSSIEARGRTAGRVLSTELAEERWGETDFQIPRPVLGRTGAGGHRVHGHAGLNRFDPRRIDLVDDSKGASMDAHPLMASYVLNLRELNSFPKESTASKGSSILLPSRPFGRLITSKTPSPITSAVGFPSNDLT